MVGFSEKTYSILIHEVRGRARFKVRGLYRSPLLKWHIEKTLGRHGDVKRVSANFVTGNVLVITSKESVDIQTINEELHNIVRSLIIKAVQNECLTNSVGTNHWHLLENAEVLQLLETNEITGLSTSEAKKRLRAFGSNALTEFDQSAGLKLFLDQFKSLPVGLLLASGGIAVLTGALVDGLFIGGVVIVNAAIGYGTVNQANRAIKSLFTTKETSVEVIREGTRFRLSQKNLVPGDITYCGTGQVPADARILKAENLTVDESALTGESLPVAKRADKEPAGRDTNSLGDRRNILYHGSVITGGVAKAVVITTGNQTELGEINRLTHRTDARETPLQGKMRRLGNQTTILASALCGGVFLIGLLRGYSFVEMLKSSVTLAVAAIPEGLPMVTTSTLALGIGKMRNRNLLIRRLEAIEALGSMDVICLDKTGTLTENQMQVTHVVTPAHKLHLKKNSIHSLKDNDDMRALLQAATLCNDAKAVKNGNGKIRYTGSATEVALLKLSANIIDVQSIATQFKQINVQQRGEDQPYMVTVHEKLDEPKKLFLSIKGNPSDVLSKCTYLQKDGNVCSMQVKDREEILRENANLAAKALRVLGFAGKEATDRQTDQTDFENLVWLGLVSMQDPPRKDSAEVIKALHKAGIQTMMITGDQRETAEAIGAQLGIIDTEMADSGKIYARVNPSEKVRIVESLIKNAHVVAMTGDGVNDAPALKSASIGIAMGKRGTNVAREIADVVLKDDDLSSILLGVKQGRQIGDNLRKAFKYLAATNLSEIIVMFLGIATGIGRPLNPKQLLWINLLTDIFPDLALALEPAEDDVLTRSPRYQDRDIFSKNDALWCSLDATSIAAGSLFAYLYGLRKYGKGEHASSLAFSSLTVSQLLHAFSARSEVMGLFTHRHLRANPKIFMAVGLGILGDIIAFVNPTIRRLLGHSALNKADLLATLACGASPYIVNECTKLFRVRSSLQC